MYSFNYAGKPLEVTIHEDGTFRVINQSTQLITDIVLLQIVEEEIKHWHLEPNPCPFQFTYSIQCKGCNDNTKQCDHRFVRTDYQVRAEFPPSVASSAPPPSWLPAENVGKYHLTNMYRKLISVHECELCGFAYETEVKHLL